MEDAPPAQPGAPRARGAWLHAGPAAALGLVGLLPWIAAGPQLPLQNLWGSATLPEDMPIVLLPISQYALQQLFALLVTGAAAAGLYARLATRRAPGRAATLPAAIGVFGVQLVAAIQSLATVGAGLGDDPRAKLYLGAMIVWVALLILAGVAVFSLIARAGRPAATVGLAVAALAAAGWLQDVVRPPFSGEISWSPWRLEISGAVHDWGLPILVGAALAWCGLHGGAAVAAWIGSLAILWLLPAAFAGLGYVAGSRALLASPSGDLPGAALGMFGVVATSPETSLRPVVVALVVGLVGTLAVRVVGHPREERRGAPEHR